MSIQKVPIVIENNKTPSQSDLKHEIHIRITTCDEIINLIQPQVDGVIDSSFIQHYPLPYITVFGSMSQQDAIFALDLTNHMSLPDVIDMILNKNHSTKWILLSFSLALNMGEKNEKKFIPELARKFACEKALSWDTKMWYMITCEGNIALTQQNQVWYMKPIVGHIYLSFNSDFPLHEK